MQSPGRIEYKKRRGTVNLGSIYEDNIVTLLCLQCLRQTQEDFWIASNAADVGIFDDVILRLGERTFMFQLKYQEKAKCITEKHFSRINDDFYIEKYIQSICKLKADIDLSKVKYTDQNIIPKLSNFDKIYFLLFTNRDADTDPNTSFCNFLIQENYHDCLSYFNSKTDSKLFKIDVTKLPASSNVQHINRFYLFCNQINVKDARNKIIEEIKEITKSTHSHKVAEDLISYITKWSNGDLGEHYCLTRQDMVSKLIELSLEDYEINLLEERFYDCKQHFLWHKIIEDKIITVIDVNENNYRLISQFLLEYIGSEIRSYCNVTYTGSWSDNLTEQNQDQLYNQNISFKRQMLKIIGSSGKIRLYDVYKCLWYFKKLPLILKINKEEQYDQILNILKLSNYAYKVIILNKSGHSLNGRLYQFENLSDLNGNHQSEILEQEIKLQGRSGAKLKDLLDDDIFKKIKTADIINILSNNFNIGKKLKTVPKYYIPRTFRNVLAWDVLKDLTEERFIIEDPNDILKDFTVKSDHIIISNKVDVVDTGSNVHFLSTLNTDYFLWKKSYGDTSKIERYLSQYNAGCEGDCLSSLVTIISADPGMGKSMLVDSIAQQTPANKWVLKIDLGKHNRYYVDLKNNKKMNKASEHLDYFKKDSLNSELELENRIFGRLVKTKDILILMDGFDEVSLYYKDEVTDMARSFFDYGLCICLTTRRAQKSHLEEVFKVSALELPQFNVDDQKRFLGKYLIKDECASTNLQVLQKFIEALLSTFSKNIASSNFTTTPLHIKLLAEFFTDNDNSLQNRYELIFNQKFDLVDLYGTFINRKEEILCDKNASKNLNIEISKIREYQSLLALKLLFPFSDSKQYILNHSTAIISNHSLILEDGILTFDEEAEKLSFVHQTFAEYLAAEWISRNINNQTDVIKQIVRKVYKDCIGHSSCYPPYPFLLTMLDSLIIRKYFRDDYLYTNLCSCIINGQVEKAKVMIDLCLGNLNTDMSKRPILNVVLKYERIHPELDSIISAIMYKTSEIYTDEFGYNPLDYALCYRRRDLADKLCKKWPNIKINFCDLCLSFVESYPFLYKSLQAYHVYKDIMLESAAEHDDISFKHTNVPLSQLPLLEVYTKSNLCYEVAFGNIDMIKKLLQTTDQVNMKDVNLLSPLHYAELHNKLEIIDLLLAEGADANITDVDDFTPLHCSIVHGNLEAFHKLVERTNLIAKGWDGHTPLHIAVLYKRVDMVKLLLSRGADTNLKTQSHLWTPLHLVSLSERFELYDSFYFEDIGGRSILIEYEEGTEKERNQIIDLFVSKCANINTTSSNGLTPLHCATICGYSEVVQKLISCGADVNTVNIAKYTPLHCAFLNPNESSLQIIRSLLSIENVNIQNVKGNTALHLCIKYDYYLRFTKRNVSLYNSIDVIDLFLNCGANVNIKNAVGETALHYAIKYGNFRIIHKLIPYITDLNAQDVAGNTPVHQALLEHRGLEILNLLLSNKADLTIRNSDGQTPLHLAVRMFRFLYPTLESGRYSKAEHSEEDFKLPYKRIQKYLDKLLGSAADVNIKNVDGETVLHLGVKYGDYTVVEKILSYNSFRDAQDNEGNTPLHLALSESHEMILVDRKHKIDLLLSSKANVNLKNVNGDTSLHIAVKYAPYEIVDNIVSCDADTNAQNSAGNSSLHLAIKHRGLDVLDLLLLNGASVNLKNKNGETPLHISVQSRHYSFKTVDKILSYNANIDAQNDEGDTPLHVALSNREWDKVDLLLLRGANVNLKNKNGETSLHFGVRYSDLHVVDRIILFNLDTNAQNNEGHTPLHLAVSLPDKLELIPLLVSNGADVNIRNFNNETLLQVSVNCNNYNTVSELITQKTFKLKRSHFTEAAVLYDPSLNYLKAQLWGFIKTSFK